MHLHRGFASLAVLLFVLLPGAVPGARADITYNFSSLDRPGSNITAAFGVDGSRIVGNYTVTNQQGFLLTGGVYTTLPSNENLPTGIEGTTIVGHSGSGSFIDIGGTRTVISHPLAISGTTAWGIAGGIVVGSYLDASASHGFIFSGGTYTAFNDPLANTGTGDGTFGRGIANDGTIVGYYVRSGVAHGFALTGGASGTYAPIDFPGAQGTYVQAIEKDNDTIAGYYTLNGAALHGFIYANGVYTTVDNPAAIDPLHGADNHIQGISGNLIVGWYSGHAYLGTLAPEPSSLSLAAAGIAGLLLRRRKR